MSGKWSAVYSLGGVQPWKVDYTYHFPDLPCEVIGNLAAAPMAPLQIDQAGMRINQAVSQKGTCLATVCLCSIRNPPRRKKNAYLLWTTSGYPNTLKQGEMATISAFYSEVAMSAFLAPSFREQQVDPQHCSQPMRTITTEGFPSPQEVSKIPLAHGTSIQPLLVGPQQPTLSLFGAQPSENLRRSWLARSLAAAQLDAKCGLLGQIMAQEARSETVGTCVENI